MTDFRLRPDRRPPGTAMTQPLFRAGSALLLALLAASNAAAQEPRFFYPDPPPGTVRVTKDVPFAKIDDSTTLAMDVYRPAPSSAAAPALIFFLGRTRPGDARTERQTNHAIQAWARLAAANGIVGIVPDLRGPGAGEDFRRLVPYLTEHADQYGIDRERLAVFSASGNVSGAFPTVEDPRQTGIKAAVMYYGTADLSVFRLDLPVLYVRAGLDHPALNADIARLGALAIAQNAPMTLLNHPTGHHSFEWADDDAATRQIIDHTLAFVKQATTPAFQAALRDGHLDAVAAGHVSTGRFREAALAFAELLKRRPADGLLRFRYAETLLSDQQYEAACAEFRRDTPPSYNAIVPGTRACLLAGNIDPAITWLQTVRKDWISGMANDFRADSAFAPLWERADFQALFQP